MESPVPEGTQGGSDYGGPEYGDSKSLDSGVENYLDSVDNGGSRESMDSEYELDRAVGSDKENLPEVNW